MWKESLCIGVKKIDDQHRELFAKTKELLQYVNGGPYHRQNCIETILFLKQYAVTHFADEEAYQQSIGYKGFSEHQKEHIRFVRSVLEHEKRMTASGFAQDTVKEFSGMLVAWLLYHVSDSDQKIVKDAPRADAPRNDADVVTDCVANVLHKIAGFDADAVTAAGKHGEVFSVTVETAVSGGLTGYIQISYPDGLIKNIISSMMGVTPETIGEWEISALLETSSIISRVICRQIANDKGVGYDMDAPRITQRTDEIPPDELITLDTGKGIVEVGLSLC